MDLDGWLDFDLTGWDTFELQGTAAGVAGQLTQIRTPAFETWYLTYSDAKLLTITDPGSGVATLGYDEAGKISSVMDAAGRVTTLTVDAAGDMVQVTTPELCITGMEYYEDTHLLHAFVEPNGARTTYGYDGENRVNAITTPQGYTTTLSERTVNCILP